MAKGDIGRSALRILTEFPAQVASTPEMASKYVDRIRPERNIMQTARETVGSIYDLFTSPIVAGANVISKTAGMVVRAPFAIPSAILWTVSNTLMTLGVLPMQMGAVISDKIGYTAEKGLATTLPNSINGINKSVRGSLQKVLGLEAKDAPLAMAA